VQRLECSFQFSQRCTGRIFHGAPRPLPQSPQWEPSVDTCNTLPLFSEIVLERLCRQATPTSAWGVGSSLGLPHQLSLNPWSYACFGCGVVLTLMADDAGHLRVLITYLLLLCLIWWNVQVLPIFLLFFSSENKVHHHTTCW
jgi:hypothetical protein